MPRGRLIAAPGVDVVDRTCPAWLNMYCRFTLPLSLSEHSREPVEGHNGAHRSGWAGGWPPRGNIVHSDELTLNQVLSILRPFRRARCLGQWLEGLWVETKWVVGSWVVGLWVAMEKSRNTMQIS